MRVAELPLVPAEVAAHASAAEVADPTAPAGRFIRRTLRHVGLPSVLRFASAFYAALAATWFLAMMVLFFVAKVTGAVGSIESFVHGIGLDVRLTWFEVTRVLLGLGILGAVLWTAATLLAAYLFNLVADVVGGVEVTMRQDDREQG